MTDTYRRYAAIKQGLMQFFHPRPTGHREQHLNTLVALSCGLTGASGLNSPPSPIMPPVMVPIRKA